MPSRTKDQDKMSGFAMKIARFDNFSCDCRGLQAFKGDRFYVKV
jgi:hypothetical protein